MLGANNEASGLLEGLLVEGTWCLRFVPADDRIDDSADSGPLALGLASQSWVLSSGVHRRSIH